MEETKKEFEKEFFKRSSAAFAYTGFISLTVLLSVILVTGSLGYHPVPIFGMAFLLLMAAGVETSLTTFGFKVYDHHTKSRFDAIVSLFDVKRWGEAVLRSVLGAVLAWIVCKSYTSSPLLASCGNRPDRCLDVTQVGCIIFGGFCGLMAGLGGKESLVFPSSHLPLTSVLKNACFPIIRDALMKAVSSCILFLPIFAWKGIGMCSFIAEALHSHLDRETFLSLVSPVFCVPLIISGAIVYAIRALTFVLFQYFQTKHIFLPIGSPNLDTTHTARLQHGLLASNKLYQNLAFHDLKFLAEQDGKRRKDLFGLSTPGGHPHNWNAIFTACLDTIKSFTARIDPQAQRISPNEEQRSPAQSGAITPGILKPRNMAELYRTSPDVGAPAEKKVEKGLIESWKEKALKRIMEVPVIKYFFGVNEVAELLNVISESQPARLSVHILGHLCSIAKDEDEYGIVQKDLSHIITTLVECQMALEKQTRIPIHNRKPILTTVRSAMYRITYTYGKQIMSLHLDDSVTPQLTAYLNLRMMG